MPHLIAGVITITLGVLGIMNWWDNFGDFLRGCVPLLLIIGGLIAMSTGLQLLGNKKD